MISRSRGHLPHIEHPGATYFITFHLCDSLPAVLLSHWKNELNIKSSCERNNPSALSRLQHDYYCKIESQLDSHSGNCWLQDPKIASIVETALRYFDRERYDLLAWTIMPNHVHVMFTTLQTWTLSSITHSWKSYTAKRANTLLHRTGHFWQREYFDRLIRSERQMEFTVRYILNNPVKAGLCKEPQEWPWSGCSSELHDLIRKFW